ncbi:transglycosylase SLT domain-containing protein [Gammaproteobacteria bacterium]|nr:transglycosylase SLT domain-containing protein [Gammaproteobacteria bacterium]
MSNFFQHFLIILIIVSFSGCSKVEEVNPIVTECAQYTKIAAETLTLNNFDKNKFADLLDSRFYKFKDLFLEAEELTNFDWEFLAAVSFQESQWNPRAKSNMGVRGMMMLTQQTAKSLGITNRIDPRNSIIGGSRHLADISAAINYGLTDSDRINFALATYNLGATNINNAIAQIDIEPQLLTWNDLKKELLVLDGDELYFKPQNGYSRGQQTIDFVERTREYALLMRVFSCKDSINQLTAASGT